MIGLGLRLRALGRPGHSGTSSFPKKKKNTLGQLGTRANARFQKTVMGTRALRHSSKNYQKTIKKTIQRLSKRLSVTIYIPKMIVSSVRSSNSHPDLLVTHHQHPHFFRSQRSPTLDFHFLSHYSYIKAIMLYKTKLGKTLAYSGILWHTLANFGIL